jgi:hypothetical protein
MSSPLEFTKDFVDIVAGVVQIIATVAGALWVYYRFIRGRTFKPRLSLSVSTRCVRAGSVDWIECTLKVHNVGLSKVDLRDAYLELRFLAGASDPLHLATVRTLRTHSWIEPGATLNEQEIVRCKHRNGIVQVDFKIVGSGTSFRAKGIIDVPASPLPDVMDRKETQ